MPIRIYPMLLCLAFAAGYAHAERADRDKPVNLEADTVTMDDAQHLSTYQGRVRLTQGTLTILADKLVVKQDAEGFQYGTAYGNPASFRQKREGFDEYIEGFAQRIEYDGKQEKVQLFTQARVKRNQDEVRGNYISYDAKTEFYQVIGGKEAATPNNPQGRVRAVIQPKNTSGRPAATPAPSATPPNLRPADSIAAPREP